MKYMGSKRAMLRNGLGQLLEQEIPSASRFVDLFTGSGAVAIHVAQLYDIPVLASDLQYYSVILTEAVLGRVEAVEWRGIWDYWCSQARIQFDQINPPINTRLSQTIVEDMRNWCASKDDLPVTQAYGGYYLSPVQAVWIDVFRMNLPSASMFNTMALAALLHAASQCVAAPGHTAQPFQPTQTAIRFLEEAWLKDIVKYIRETLSSITKQFAKKVGASIVADANVIARELNHGDFVFIDPPYSAVHYSRFYHVLETIAQGKCGEVTGTGRYPANEFRPKSLYSVVSTSAKALDELLHILAERGTRGILTFPDHLCSNGLSGQIVREIANKYFVIKEHNVESEFSTLGGTGNRGSHESGRNARQKANELMLILEH